MSCIHRVTRQPCPLSGLSYIFPTSVLPYIFPTSVLPCIHYDLLGLHLSCLLTSCPACTASVLSYHSVLLLLHLSCPESILPCFYCISSTLSCVRNFLHLLASVLSCVSALSYVGMFSPESAISCPINSKIFTLIFKDIDNDKQFV